MYLIISYSKPVFWLSSYPKKPAVLLFHFAFLLAISRGRNPGRDCAECFSPTRSFRYEVHPMRCFHYPPPRYSHRPSRWKSTYRMPWHSYLKILNFHPNSQNYCQLTRYLKYGNINLTSQGNATLKNVKVASFLKICLRKAEKPPSPVINWFTEC